MNDSITVDTDAGSFRAYIARPKVLPAPAIVVLQEIFGVNADLRATCDELAAQGYVAISPDLFWRMEPGVDMSDHSEADWKKGMALYTAFDYGNGVSGGELIHSVTPSNGGRTPSMPSFMGSLPPAATATKVATARVAAANVRLSFMRTPKGRVPPALSSATRDSA